MCGNVHTQSHRSFSPCEQICRVKFTRDAGKNFRKWMRKRKIFRVASGQVFHLSLGSCDINNSLNLYRYIYDNVPRFILTGTTQRLLCHNEKINIIFFFLFFFFF
ncbi:hypothetical protein PUN28_004758 [Cardiocondyla obscurior]|uniref:Uncharacterized protein n=1 Tax=Cardiocondyla obscurior TaxID=286306 RepID=A0AAW2GHG8_9HYME